MQVKKKRSRKATGTPGALVLRESGRRIRELRIALGIQKQSAFAQRIGVSQQAVSFWENAAKLPSPEVFILLGNLAASTPGCDALWFWQQAGLDPIAAKRLVPDLERRIEDIFNVMRGKLIEKLPNSLESTVLSGRMILKRAINDLPLEDKFASVFFAPLLRSTQYCSQPAMAPEDEIETRFPILGTISSHPEKVSGLRVPNAAPVSSRSTDDFEARILIPVRVGKKEYAAGDLVRLSEGDLKTLLASRAAAIPSPLSHGSYIAIVDSSQTEFASLYGQLVVVETGDGLQLGWPNYSYLGEGKFLNSVIGLDSTKSLEGCHIVGAVVGIFFQSGK